MAFEIDFLPVGEGEKSGDAIALRYGADGNFKVMVFDGGTKDSGELLVETIKNHYGTTRVDYVVNSHPDADHASGLEVVLENLQVGQLWMHRPWNYSSVILEYFRDGRLTDTSLAERLKDKMAHAWELEKIASRKGIPIFEPFRGSRIGEFVVLSPEKDWYVHELVPAFEKAPEVKLADRVASAFPPARAIQALAGTAVAAAAAWLEEHWHIETLREDVETTAENESSAILYGRIAGAPGNQHGILLTGDAGVKALASVAEFAESQGHSLPNNIHFIQIPHHGGRHNVSTKILDRIVGPRKAAPDGQYGKHSLASVGKGSETHPRKAVVNAFIRRGVWVGATKGRHLSFQRGMPQRNGWNAIAPLEFSQRVESWD